MRFLLARRLTTAATSRLAAPVLSRARTAALLPPRFRDAIAPTPRRRVAPMATAPDFSGPGADDLRALCVDACS